VILTVIHPPFHLEYLAWVAFVPFMLAVFSPVPIYTLAWISYGIALVYWLANVYWIGFVAPPAYVLFCLYLAMYWPLLVVGLRFCAEHTRVPCPWRCESGTRRQVPVPMFLTVALLVVGAEAWQGIFLTGFEWRLLGQSQYAHTRLIQIADVFGHWGVSFLVALVNGFIVQLALAVRRTGPKALSAPRHLAAVGLVAVLLAGTWVYGGWRIAQSEESVRPGPRIGSVQPNIPSQIKELSEAAEPIVQDLIARSTSCYEAGAELVIWPETIVLTALNPGYVNYCRPDTTPVQLDALLRGFVKDQGYLLTGAHGVDLHFEGVEPVVMNRYNSAYLYRPDGTQSPQHYDKIHLIPFGEYIPFRYSLPPLYHLVVQLSPYDYDYHLTAGREYTVFQMPSGEHLWRFGVLICYEDTDTEVTRRIVLGKDGRKRVDWLANISNDGWYVRYEAPAAVTDDGTGPEGYRLNQGRILPSTELAQRTAIAVFRAVENRVAIIRSVNTGISCLIDSVGRIHDGYAAGDLPHEAMKRQGVAGWFVDTIPVDSRVTVFSRVGPWLKWLCAAVFAGVIGVGLFGRKERRMRVKLFWMAVLVLLGAVTAGCTEGQQAADLTVPGLGPTKSLQEQAIDVVRQGLTHENSYVRTAAVQVVLTAKRRDLMPIAARLLEDKVAPVRFVAALAVGELDYYAASSLLSTRLKDPDPSVRLAAAYAMARQGQREHIETIRRALNDPSPKVRANAIMLLGKLGDASDIRRLYQRLGADESDSRVRLQAVLAIAQLKDPNIYREKLWPLLISVYPDDRVVGIEGMAALGTSDARNAILTMLDDDLIEVRLFAAGQLGKLGDPTGRELVQAYLERMPPTREQTLAANEHATMAIGYIGGQSLEQHLPALLRDDSPMVCLGAAQSTLLRTARP
jgi:apolipoprotein N-acyltransferase